MSKTPPTIPGELPLALTTLLQRCLDYSATHRPSAVDLVAALRDVIFQQQVWLDLQGGLVVATVVSYIQNDLWDLQG